MAHSSCRASLAGALACAILAAPTLAQSVSNPELFRKSFEAAQGALRAYGAYSDPVAARRVADIGYRIVQESQFTQFPITFFLVEMPEPNAFALPGGQVFVTRGMLEMGLDDDMLAGLLGHEIAHVVYQHGIKMERRALLLNILSQAALVGVILKSDHNRSSRDPVPTYDAYGRETDTNSGDLIQGTAAAGIVLSELLLRSYSREFEDQADEEGQRWAAAAGFNPAGTSTLFDLMRVRLPQDKQYGYWQTHPFFDTRVNAALARGQTMKAQPAKPAEAVRSKTQDALLAWLAAAPKEPTPPLHAPAPPRSGEGMPDRRRPNPDLEREPLIKQAALAAQPRGVVAEALRLERLHVLRARQLELPKLARDYGSLLGTYRQELGIVAELSPDSRLAATLRQEAAVLEADAAALYPEAQAVLSGGIYETAFLETFLSNFPTAPERPRVSLALGDAYSTIGRQANAVDQYLATLAADPASEPAQRARRGLRVLASSLGDLAALQQLALQADEAETRTLAAERLAKIVPTFGDIGAGAEYLRRFATGPHALEITARMNALADNLYGEMVLYQAVGDSINALDRIQKILNHAPTSPAAARLRESAETKGS